MLEPGDRLGRYTVVKPLGAPGEGGGQGSVYLAEDDQGGRFAVKVPHRHGPRFERELAAAKAVQSRRVARVWDYDLSVPLIAYEHVPGTTLSRTLDAGDLAADELPRLFAQVADGLADIHAVSTRDIPALSHGDLTLDNIMVTPGGEAVIVDLGAVGTGAGHTISRDGIGKAGYWAPEQLTGPSRGAATDVWQLGVCMARAGTGHMPFPYENMLAVLERAPNVDGLPLWLADAVARCLVTDPGARPTASELKKVLDWAGRGVEEDRETGLGSLQRHRLVRRVTDIRFEVDELGLIRRAAVLGPASEDLPPLRFRGDVAVGDYAKPIPSIGPLAVAEVPAAFRHHERQHVPSPLSCPVCGTGLHPTAGNWRVYEHGSLVGGEPVAVYGRRRAPYGLPETVYCPNAESCSAQARSRLRRAFSHHRLALHGLVPTPVWPEDVLDSRALRWPDTSSGQDDRTEHARKIDALARVAARHPAVLLRIYSSPVEALPQIMRRQLARDHQMPVVLASLTATSNPYSGLPDGLQVATDGWWAERGHHVRAGARLLLDRAADLPDPET